MKATYGGAEISITGNAWFADLGEAVPIFHAWSGPPGEDGKTRTRCGLVLAISSPPAFRLTPIPPRLAVRFGRPCRRCWPALLARPTLFARPSRGSGRDGSQLDLEAAL